MNVKFLKQIFIWLIKANILLWTINFLILILVFFSGLYQGANFTTILSKLSLLETGVLLIVGGAISFSGSASSSKTRELLLKTREDWSMDKLKVKEKRANKYLLLAGVLFVESLLISLMGY